MCKDRIFTLIKIISENFCSEPNFNLDIKYWVIMHIYMEMSQGKPMYSYLKKQKNHEGRKGPV
jgi:hypothetical protein